MAGPTENFNLSVKDIAQIELALRLRMGLVDHKEKQEINRLLGKLHYQKIWYRPKDKVYVSG